MNFGGLEGRVFSRVFGQNKLNKHERKLKIGHERIIFYLWGMTVIRVSTYLEEALGSPRT